MHANTLSVGEVINIDIFSCDKKLLMNVYYSFALETDESNTSIEGCYCHFFIFNPTQSVANAIKPVTI
jgi:hypothetical protein